MTSTENTLCCIADCKKKPTMMCLGCPNLIYCNMHYKQHRDNLNVELQILTDKCNQFRAEIETGTEKSKMHPLIKSINEWEERSITKVRQLAQETREKLLENVNNVIPKLKTQLEDLRIKVHQDPDDCEFMDTDIRDWTRELERLISLLNNPSDISIREAPTEFISKLHLDIRGKAYDTP